MQRDRLLGADRSRIERQSLTSAATSSLPRGACFTLPLQPQSRRVLCLNFNADIQRVFDKDLSGFITRANANWPKL